MSAWYERRPTSYPRDKTAVTADVEEVWIFTAVAIIGVAVVVQLLGLEKTRKALAKHAALLLNIVFGALILLAQFSYGWETASVTTVTLYSPFEKEIHADIGLHVGLRGINVTLKGVPEHQVNETINYNERFRWDWQQGRFGFGSSAGRIQREYREALDEGFPLPITWVVEYFTFDEERIRWGRYYRLAGYYTHALLWLALMLWFMEVVTAAASPEVSTMFMFATGVTLLASAIAWYNIRPGDLVIPFEDGVLDPKVGWTWIMVLVMGIVSTLVSLVSGIYLFRRYATLIRNARTGAPAPRRKKLASSDERSPARPTPSLQATEIQPQAGQRMEPNSV